MPELTFMALETMGSPRAVMLENGGVVLFRPDDENSVFKLIGVTQNASTKGGMVRVVSQGLIESASAFVNDAVYFAGASGVLTSNPPTSGIRAKIGIAQSKNRLIVDMSEPLILA